MAAIILAPPIIYGYIYPNIGDDTAEHLKAFEEMDKGIFPSDVYPGIYSGQLHIGRAVNFISEVTDLDRNALFLWFNFVVLIVVAITTMGFAWRLANKWAGLITPFVLLFVSYSVISLFEHGVIFSVINMYILLPVFVLFLITWIESGKLWQLGALLVATALVSTFHTTSVYILPMTLVSSTVLIAYFLKKKKTAELKRTVISILPIIAINVLWFIYSPYFRTEEMIRQTANSIVTASPFSTIKPPTIIDLIMTYISPTVTMLFCLAMVKIRRGEIPERTKLALIILGSLSLVLAFGSFTRFTYDPTRIAFDLAGILVLAMCLIIGITIEQLRGKGCKLFRVVFASCILLGAMPVLLLWFNYSNAVKPADIMAMDYLNTKSNSTFAGSSYVAEHLYERYIKQTQAAENPDYYIERNEPMTPRADPKNYWFVEKPMPNLDNLVHTKTFLSGSVTIKIYERIQEVQN